MGGREGQGVSWWSSDSDLPDGVICGKAGMLQWSPNINVYLFHIAICCLSKKNNTVLEFEKQVPNLVTVQQQNSNKTNVLLSQGCQGPSFSRLGKLSTFWVKLGNFAFTQWFTKTIKTILIVLNIVTWTSAKSLSKDIPVHELNVQMYHYCLLGNFSGLKENFGRFSQLGRWPLGRVCLLNPIQIDWWPTWY